MVISYPRLMLGRVLVRSGLVTERSPYFGHPDSDFSVYALAHVVTIFRPSLPWLGKTLPPFPPDTAEFTFRLGTTIPVLASALLAVLVVLFLRGPLPQRKRVLQQSLIWSAAAFLLLLFALSPRYVLSLVPLTHKIAPMFRVGVRALLFVHLGVLFILGLLFDHFLTTELGWSHEWKSRSLSPRRIALTAARVPAVVGAC